MSISKFEINKKSKKDIVGYYIKITWMHGDADGYTTNIIGKFLEEEKEELFDAIETCQRMLDCCEDCYEGNVEGFEKWFITENNTNSKAIDIEEDITTTVWCGEQRTCLLDKYEVFYLDENSNKYNCNFEIVSEEDN